MTKGSPACARIDRHPAVAPHDKQSNQCSIRQCAAVPSDPDQPSLLTWCQLMQQEPCRDQGRGGWRSMRPRNGVPHRRQQQQRPHRSAACRGFLRHCGNHNACRPGSPAWHNAGAITGGQACTTGRSSQHSARNTLTPRAATSSIPPSSRSSRSSSRAATGGACPMPTSRPFSTHPTGPRRRRPPISAGSTWRSSGSPWIWV